MKRMMLLALALAVLLAMAAGIAETAEEETTVAAAIVAAAEDALALEGDADGDGGAVSMPSEVSERVAFDEADAPYEGKWVTFEDGFKLYVPAEWRRFKLTDAQFSAGLFYRSGNDGRDSVVGRVPMGVAVSYVHAGKLSSVEELAVDFAAVGFEGIDVLDLNGIPVVTFRRAAGDYRGVAFYHYKWPNYVMTVYVSPGDTDNETAYAVGEAILRSLTPFSMDELETAPE